MNLEELKKNFSDIHINGTMDKRLPGNLNISFKDIEASELLYRLDEYGICASGKSACSSGEDKPSHVLSAIGLSGELSRSIEIRPGEGHT